MLNVEKGFRQWPNKKFGSDVGQVMIIGQALYGLKSSGAALKQMLAESLSAWDLHNREAIQMCTFVWLITVARITMSIY